MKRAWRAATEDGLVGEIAADEGAVDDDPIGRIGRFSHPRKLPTLIATSAIAAGMLLWNAFAPGGDKVSLLRGLDSHALAASPGRMEGAPAPRLPEAQIPGGSTGGYVHPLPGTSMLLPDRSTRRFGAERDGGGRARGCGQGHCGVDIGERVGAPIVSIADGLVTKVVRFDNFHGGLYVRIDHADDTSSFYFHLDGIRKDLRTGSQVRAGEAIGTLGRTGIQRSAPHLHFAIALREGDQDHYVDPEPYLRDSVLLAAPTAGADAEMSGNAGPSIARLAERRAADEAALAEMPGLDD